MPKFLCATLIGTAVVLCGPLSVKADIAPYPRPRRDEPPSPPRPLPKPETTKPDTTRQKDGSNPQDLSAQDRQPPNKDAQ
jgi:hypothetical protein